MKKRDYAIIGTIIFLWSAACVLVTIKVMTIHKKHNFDIEPTEAVSEIAKYPFLGNELSDYICELCEEMNVDSDLVVAHLMEENPEYNPVAIHRNENGTVDCGLFQLNDKYVWNIQKKLLV